ncbi:aminoglycoside phosphotransferase family protein [Nocardiopsis sp. CT-R113]|uniref:Aminoglycoside phosphotransferase family protein n=1 Tax=Nocardiopsis codii TaxID=3065942 RepID=A0ABU7KBZ5_9ACTN|nr:aminoglycoside phosphotransferase family protein [Nocardiopsis sp. CT-R113]MEE2039577.1 aminoglycoside phosphotransferase family protein [Nocardiopsis sp. CT-R113]
MRTPAAEVAVTVDLVRSLLREQHPDLAGLPLTLHSSGWDNVILRLGDDLAVRIPRRGSAAALAANEQRWLGPVAARAGVPVPAPVRVGRPGCGYPWPWSVIPWFEGRVAAALPVPERGRLAAPLAAFTARMHVPAPGDAPPNPVRGVPLASRDARVRERLAGAPFPRADELLPLWERLSATAVWQGPPVWIHGDLHPANILASTGGAPGLAAVLDFGDLTSGDPATDLAVAWMMFDAPGRAAFRAARERLSPVDPATWDRARAWAVSFGSLMASPSTDNPLLAAVGAHTVDQVLSASGH